MKKMKSNKYSKAKKAQRKPVNIYAWGQKNKKTFAGVICIILVIGLLVGLLQI